MLRIKADGYQFFDGDWPGGSVVGFVQGCRLFRDTSTVHREPRTALWWLKPSGEKRPRSPTASGGASAEMENDATESRGAGTEIIYEGVVFTLPAATYLKGDKYTVKLDHA